MVLYWQDVRRLVRFSPGEAAKLPRLLTVLSIGEIDSDKLTCPKVLATEDSVDLAASAAPTGPVSPVLDTDTQSASMKWYILSNVPFRTV